ncbi:hypothetical protein O181_086303 [Austropuccinia psidii MF-1]|uniref:Uncharacterized protein n=1 Tax=Austropuccinia psidii MF-1 TaxID=1389203 RepID=A0A9Q3FUS3_9BASI|nr:hypothetical protein [Austropuccinia psidii MF-1]
MVLDPLKGSFDGPIYGPMAPLDTQQNWAQGASNSLHNPWTTVYKPQPMDCGIRSAVRGLWTIGQQREGNGQEGPYTKVKPISPKTQKKAQKAIKSKIIKNNFSKGQGPKDYGRARGRYFQGKWRQDPLKTLLRKF